MCVCMLYDNGCMVFQLKAENDILRKRIEQSSEELAVEKNK